MEKDSLVSWWVDRGPKRKRRFGELSGGGADSGLATPAKIALPRGKPAAPDVSPECEWWFSEPPGFFLNRRNSPDTLEELCSPLPVLAEM